MNFGNFNQNKIENQLKSNQNFFDDYPEYIDEEKGLNSYQNRLNKRYNALIEYNKKIIQGKRILDIASHDGRWTFAALKAGANHVIGIEIVSSAVQLAIKNMKMHPEFQGKYEFIVANIDEEIMKFKEEKFDTIFCFGYLYHTLNQMQLIKEFKRLNPEHIIFDTHVSTSEKPVIELKKMQLKNPNAPIGKINVKLNNQILEGWPSKSALELMLEQIGYDYEYYDWFDQGINNWERLDDYKRRIRVTLVAKRK